MSCWKQPRVMIILRLSASVTSRQNITLHITYALPALINLTLLLLVRLENAGMEMESALLCQNLDQEQLV